MDIVDRLRALADCDSRAGEPLGKSMREAADEIERLRAALSEIADPKRLASHGDPVVLRDHARAALAPGVDQVKKGVG